MCNGHACRHVRTDLGTRYKRLMRLERESRDNPPSCLLTTK
jgi:hypothetical protein